MNTTLLHLSDTHLGYQQYHKPERGRDFTDAFTSVISDALEENVDGVVHSGDIFHRSRPSIRTLSTLVTQLQRLADADIPFYTIVGNHDSTREKQWPTFLQQLGLAEYLDYDGAVIGDVTLYGQDHVSTHERERLEYNFAQPETAHTCLVAHGLFQPFPHGDWDLQEILSKSPVEFDAVLLGDDHNPQQKEVDNTPVTYAGSTERTAADQQEQRGYNIVRFDDDAVNVGRVPIDTRQFRYVSVSLDDSEGTEKVISEVESAEIPNGCVLIVNITESSAGNRVTPADVERVGNRNGALVTQFNDRRDIDDNYEESGRTVSLRDPDTAVNERKKDISISPVADRLESTARDFELAKSNLRQETMNIVTDVIEQDDGSSMVASSDSSPSESTDESNANSDVLNGQQGTASRANESSDDDTTTRSNHADNSPSTTDTDENPNNEQLTFSEVSDK